MGLGMRLSKRLSNCDYCAESRQPNDDDNNNNDRTDYFIPCAIVHNNYNVLNFNPTSILEFKHLDHL